MNLKELTKKITLKHYNSSDGWIGMTSNLQHYIENDDLELLAKINTKDDIKKLAKQHGYDDKRIKNEL
jgi:uncharacterized protein (UPF0216 family)